MHVRTMIQISKIAVATILLGAASSATAHHSAAMFDQTREVTLSGTVRDFQWTSPHCYIQLLASKDSSPVQEWSLEMAAPMYLYRLGWRPSTVKAGDKITVSVHPLRDGKRGGLLFKATTADGRQLGGK
jgi:Family of unknown function (DUF6152)